MTEEARRYAFCRLLLKGEHWGPWGLDTEPTAEHRSRHDGPVVSALLVAVVQDNRIVGWTRADFLVREVQADGTLAPLDLTIDVAALEAGRLDFEAERAGAVGIKDLLIRRRREQERGRVAEHLQRAAIDRATIQIMDRFMAFALSECV
jgi:hypothetical protein